jgi:hypothetical protein
MDGALYWALGAAGLISAAWWLLALLPGWLALPAIIVVAVWLTRAVDARVRRARGRRSR